MSSYIIKGLRSAAAALVMLSTPLKAQTTEDQSALPAPTYTFKEIKEQKLNTILGADKAASCPSLVAVMKTNFAGLMEYTLDELKSFREVHAGNLAAYTEPDVRRMQDKWFIGGNREMIKTGRFSIQQLDLATEELESALKAVAGRPGPKERIQCTPLTS